MIAVDTRFAADRPPSYYTGAMNISLKPFLHIISWLVIPLAVLLLAQWPLREASAWLGSHARTANDMAQIVFAIYATCAITAASVAGVHLAARHDLGRYSRAQQYGLIACILPWVLWMTWASVPMAWRAALSLEKFSETLTPGFFIIKLAVLLGVGFIGWQVLRSTLTSKPDLYSTTPSTTPSTTEAQP